MVLVECMNWLVNKVFTVSVRVTKVLSKCATDHVAYVAKKRNLFTAKVEISSISVRDTQWNPLQIIIHLYNVH